MNTKEIKEILQAYIDGEVIQVKSHTDHKWYDIESTHFNFDTFLHRIKPKQTIEDRVKAEYGDFYVVMLEWAVDLLLIRRNAVASTKLHVLAQSMRGFAGYVYEFDEGVVRSSRTAWKANDGTYDHPIAVLFTRAGE